MLVTLELCVFTYIIFVVNCLSAYNEDFVSVRKNIEQ